MWPQAEAFTHSAFGVSNSQSSAREQSRSAPGKAKGQRERMCVRVHRSRIGVDL